MVMVPLGDMPASESAARRAFLTALHAVLLLATYLGTLLRPIAHLPTRGTILHPSTTLELGLCVATIATLHSLSPHAHTHLSGCHRHGPHTHRPSSYRAVRLKRASAASETHPSVTVSSAHHTLLHNSEAGLQRRRHRRPSIRPAGLFDSNDRAQLSLNRRIHSLLSTIAR